MKAIYFKIRKKLTQWFKSISSFEKGLATQTIEVELIQLENIFTLLLFGCFVGLPSPPVHLTLKLLPEMEEELTVMINRVSTSKDPLGELFSTLDVT